MNQSRLNELNQILATSRDLKSFYQHFLALSASMCAAPVGVAWRGKSVPFEPICQVRSQSASVPRLSLSEQRHNELLQQAVDDGKSFIVMPSEPSAAQPPLLFGAIKRQSQTEIVELVLPPDQDENTRREVIAQLDEYCRVATGFQESGPGNTQQTDAVSTTTTAGLRTPTPQTIDQYVDQIHRSIAPTETASNVANEARRLLDCDRVTVVTKSRGKFRVTAISGQPSVNRRSNVVKSLGVLGTRTLKTGQPFWYPATTDLIENGPPERPEHPSAETETGLQLPQQIAEPLNEYLSFASTRSMAILPVFDRATETETTPESDRSQKRPQVIAGIIVEHCEQQWDRAAVAPAIETMGRHASHAIRNSIQHEQLFLYPLWRMLGQSRIIATARNLPKTLLALAAITLLTLVLCFIPADFTLPCEGVLTPQTRSRVFANSLGRIAAIHARHGDSVVVDQSLVSLKNEDIEIELGTVEAQLLSQQQLLENNKTMRSQQSDNDRQAATQQNVRSIEAAITNLEKQRAILRLKAQRLNVTSPLAGQVVTWEVENRLLGRPVSPGEMLLEIADVDGPWQLELDLDDRRVGHLLTAMRDHDDEPVDEGLEVSFHLVAEPGTTHRGCIREVSRASQLTADQRQTLKVIVDVDVKNIKHTQHVGTSVTAKIHCGRRSLGYVWLHDVLEFMQSKVLFRLF